MRISYQVLSPVLLAVGSKSTRLGSIHLQHVIYPVVVQQRPGFVDMTVPKACRPARVEQCGIYLPTRHSKVPATLPSVSTMPQMCSSFTSAVVSPRNFGASFAQTSRQCGL